MEVMRVWADIIDVALDINDEFVELTVRDAGNHMMKIDLDEINVNKWILDEAWDNVWSEYDTAVEGFSPDEMHHQRMQALYEYLVGKDVALLEMSSVGVKVASCNNI